MKTASEPRMNKAIEKGVKHKAQGPEFACQNSLGKDSKLAHWTPLENVKNSLCIKSTEPFL